MALTVHQLNSMHFGFRMLKLPILFPKSSLLISPPPAALIFEDGRSPLDVASPLSPSTPMSLSRGF